MITKIKVPVEWVDFTHSFEARLLCTSELSCHFVGTHSPQLTASKSHLYLGKEK